MKIFGCLSFVSYIYRTDDGVCALRLARCTEVGRAPAVDEGKISWNSEVSAMTRLRGRHNPPNRIIPNLGTKTRRSRAHRPVILEPLEGRTLLSLSVTVDGNHSIEVVETAANNNLTVS
jgi:hypothetical protein